jgi:hypothetical protein
MAARKMHIRSIMPTKARKPRRRTEEGKEKHQNQHRIHSVEKPWMIRHKAPVPESEPVSLVGQQVCHPASFTWRPAFRYYWHQSPVMLSCTYSLVHVSMRLYRAAEHNGVAFPTSVFFFLSLHTSRPSLDSCRQIYVASSQTLDDNAGHMGLWTIPPQLPLCSSFELRP